MRLTKFRGQDIKTGEQVKGDLLQSNGRAWIVTSVVCDGITHYEAALDDGQILLHGYYEVHPDTVGEFTGLLDKNGKEIWENDNYMPADGRVCTVETKVDGWGLFPKDKKGPVRSLYWVNVCDKTSGEVISNVHEEKP